MAAVIGAFARLGIEEKATRQALMRTAAAGCLTAEKAGRRTRWSLTQSAIRLLTDGAERILHRASRALGRALADRLGPDSGDRPERTARGRQKAKLGRVRLDCAGPVGEPSCRAQAEAVVVLRDAGITDAHVFIATRRGLADVREMIRAAWDLTAVEEKYEQFLSSFRDPDPADVLARQLEIVHAWRKFPAIDPALPRELLPPRWSGLQAAKLFADRHQRWSEDARLEWKRLNGEG